MATIPSSQSGASPGTRPEAALEVVLDEREDGQVTIALRRLTWEGALGWCRQQTLKLTADEAEVLLRTLQKSQQKWRGTPSALYGKLIPFPGQTKKMGSFHKEAAHENNENAEII